MRNRIEGLPLRCKLEVGGGGQSVLGEYKRKPDKSLLSYRGSQVRGGMTSMNRRILVPKFVILRAVADMVEVGHRARAVWMAQSRAHSRGLFHQLTNSSRPAPMGMWGEAVEKRGAEACTHDKGRVVGKWWRNSRREPFGNGIPERISV
jgi:hypothetical protein